MSTVEKYIAIAGLGLFIMFVGEIITLYNFMIEPEQVIEPTPKILQFISIGVAPACIMTGVSYLMSRRYGSKIIAWIIISGGVILLCGMAYAYTLIDKIDPDHLVDAVIMVPILFMIVAIPVIFVGTLLLRIRKPKSKKSNYV
jgi:peptidoglycan/LPS O-acetylase OafA/YrhL